MFTIELSSGNSRVLSFVVMCYPLLKVLDTVVNIFCRLWLFVDCVLLCHASIAPRLLWIFCVAYVVVVGLFFFSIFIVSFILCVQLGSLSPTLGSRVALSNPLICSIASVLLIEQRPDGLFVVNDLIDCSA